MNEIRQCDLHPELPDGCHWWGRNCLLFWNNFGHPCI